MEARIIQYGDVYPNIFVFPQFDVTEDWSDEQPEGLITIPQYDGAYSPDYGYLGKAPKVLTKRFTLSSSELERDFLANASAHDLDGFCKFESTYKKFYKDYMYRVLRGNVVSGGHKRLYVQMEDGSIRWNLARSTLAPYENSGTGEINMNITFVMPDPYFYEVDNNHTYYFEEYNILGLLKGCADLNATPENMVGPGDPLCYGENTECEKLPLIVRDPDYIGLNVTGCVQESCIKDPCSYYLGEFYYPFASSDIEICVTGSAGATRPFVSFRGNWLNPSLNNLTTNCILSYSGTIGAGEYLEIDLNSSETGDVEDLDINTNIPGFDVNNLTVNKRLWDLTTGVNELSVAGALDSQSTFTIFYLNRYHN